MTTSNPAAVGDVAAIIVNWNSSADTLCAIETLREQHPLLYIVVIDNASAVDDYARLCDTDVDFTLIRRATNGGYGAGVNSGLKEARQAGKTLAWLINPDSAPVEGCLDRLVSEIESAAACGPNQFSSPSQDVEGSRYVSAALVHDRRVTHVDCPGCSRGAHPVDIVTGTGILLRIDRALSIGGMREDFFHYKEEFEFIERLSRHGTVKYVCVAYLWHARGASLSHHSPASTYYRVRNELLYIWLRQGRMRGLPRSLRFAARSFLRARGRRHRTAIAVGLVHGFAGRTGPRER